MKLFKYISSKLENGVRRLLANGLGSYDPREGYAIAPYGTDACPVKGVRVVYSVTSRDGDEVMLGVVNTQQVARAGEHRIYATKENGDLTHYIWLHNTTAGGIELNGTGDNLVRYVPMNTGLQSMVTGINNNLALIAVAVNAIVPGSYTPVTVTLDVTAAKVNDLKCSA